LPVPGIAFPTGFCSLRQRFSELVAADARKIRWPAKKAAPAAIVPGKAAYSTLNSAQL
jgi:hypothetical protein